MRPLDANLVAAEAAGVDVEARDLAERAELYDDPVVGRVVPPALPPVKQRAVGPKLALHRGGRLHGAIAQRRQEQIVQGVSLVVQSSELDTADKGGTAPLTGTRRRHCASAKNSSETEWIVAPRASEVSSAGPPGRASRSGCQQPGGGLAWVGRRSSPIRLPKAASRWSVGICLAML